MENVNDLNKLNVNFGDENFILSKFTKIKLIKIEKFLKLKTQKFQN